ncbi:MAG: hypothetical protein N3H31_01710 [Candidatus Nezhaarchaeota archaeon]|nr:hypothetical protein [Candidatus Nezhaarchaeota archaeon]
MNASTRIRRGASEVISALTLSFIVLVLMSVIAAAFTQSSKNELESYIAIMRRDRARLLEHVALISINFSGGVTLWLFNAGQYGVEVEEVYVDGAKMVLNPAVTIPPGKALPIKLNIPLNPKLKHELIVRTSSGGVFRFETPAQE